MIRLQLAVRSDGEVGVELCTPSQFASRAAAAVRPHVQLPASSVLTRAFQWMSKPNLAFEAIAVRNRRLWRRCGSARALEDGMLEAKEEAAKLKVFFLAVSNPKPNTNPDPTLTLTTDPNPKSGQECEQLHEKVGTDFHVTRSVLQAEQHKDAAEMKRLDQSREQRRVSLLEARPRLVAAKKDADRLAVSEADLKSEEAQKEAALVRMQAVREQMRLWWRFPNPKP